MEIEMAYREKLLQDYQELSDLYLEEHYVQVPLALLCAHCKDSS